MVTRMMKYSFFLLILKNSSKADNINPEVTEKKVK